MKRFTYAILFFGIVFRLIWASDMEWKYDEAWMVEMAKAIATGERWSWLGMRSGVNVRNPGMSIWPFSFFALFSGSHLAMVRWVMGLNIATIIGYLILIKKRINVEENQIWLLGILLMSVSPLAVIFSRKIWAQDILPFFTFFIILGHLYRHKIWGILLWGAIGALVGQIHMSGFFFSFGLFLATLIYDRTQKRKWNWFRWWVVGSIIGTLPMLPWLSYLIEAHAGGGLKWKNIYKFRFFYFWIFDAFGIHLRYSLKNDFWEFIRFPILMGIPTYLTGMLHLFLIFTGFYQLKKLKAYFTGLKYRIHARIFFENWSELDFYLFACLLGMGIVMGFSGVTVHEHYLIIAYPFVYLWLAKLISTNLKMLKAIIISQAMITGLFLLFIHLNQGSLQGDYGKTYSRQIKEGITPQINLGQ